MRRLVAAVAVVLASVAPGVAASAQSAPPGIPTVDPPVDPTADPSAPAPPPAAPLPDPSPQVAVVLAKLHVLDVQQALAVAQSVFDAATADAGRAHGIRDLRRRERDAAHDLLAGAVRDAYVRDGLQTTSEFDVRSADVLLEHALDRDLDGLRDAEAALAVAQQAADAADKRQQDARTARDAAQAAVDEAILAVADAGRLTSRNDASPTVMGDAVLTADELVGWYRAEAVQGYAGRVDIVTMAGYYVDEGVAEHIRGDVAFAQSMVETGAFTSPLTTHNNFAGIGACDTCPTGFDFRTPQEGVRAQAQLLHAYADKTLRVSSLAHPPVGSNPDQLSVRGCCTTWNKLTGTWATDPNYGPKIMTVYLSMLQYALTQRTTAAAAAAAPLPAAAPTAAVVRAIR